MNEKELFRQKRQAQLDEWKAKSSWLTKEAGEAQREWYVIDATGHTRGRSRRLRRGVGGGLIGGPKCRSAVRRPFPAIARAPW